VIESHSTRRQTWTASLVKVAAAGAAGVFLGGIGSAILFRSNLAPLTGFLQTGPFCALGVLFFETSRHAHTARRSAAIALGGAWALALLYALMMLRISPTLAGSAVAVEIVGVCASMVVFWRITEHKRVTAAVGLTLGTLVAATLLVPALKATGGFAGFALYLDTRFSGRHHAPLLNIDWRVLGSEWALLLVIGATVALSGLYHDASHHRR